MTKQTQGNEKKKSYKIYLRIAKSNKGFKVDASHKPNYKPIYKSTYSKEAYPTLSSALVLNIPDEKFKEAERVVSEINLKLEDLEVNSEVVEREKEVTPHD